MLNSFMLYSLGIIVAHIIIALLWYHLGWKYGWREGWYVGYSDRASERSPDLSKQQSS